MNQKTAGLSTVALAKVEAKRKGKGKSEDGKT